MPTRIQPTDAEKHPIDMAAERAGGRRALASRLNVTEAAVGNWKARGVPAEHCPRIEQITGVQCELLRPDVAWDVLRAQSTPQPAEQGVGNA